MPKPRKVGSETATRPTKSSFGRILSALTSCFGRNANDSETPSIADTINEATTPTREKSPTTAWDTSVYGVESNNDNPLYDETFASKQSSVDSQAGSVAGTPINTDPIYDNMTHDGKHRESPTSSSSGSASPTGDNTRRAASRGREVTEWCNPAKLRQEMLDRKARNFRPLTSSPYSNQESLTEGEGYASPRTLQLGSSYGDSPRRGNIYDDVSNDVFGETNLDDDLDNKPIGRQPKR